MSKKFKFDKNSAFFRVLSVVVVLTFIMTNASVSFVQAASLKKEIVFIDSHTDAATDTVKYGSLMALSTDSNFFNRFTLFGVADTTAPYILSISRADISPTNSNSVHFTVTFDESITGVDTSDFTVVGTGSATGVITGLSGSGSTYTVSVNSISGTGTLRLDLKSSGTGIQDAANNPIAAGYTSGVAYTIDQSAPVVNSVTAPANSAYGTGQNLDFTVAFNKAVTVASGSPYIDLTLNAGGTVHAVYVSGSGGSSLVFRYTVASGNLDNDGVVLGSTINLNGASIKDWVGNNAVPTLNSVASTTRVTVDTEMPLAFSVSVPNNGTYIEGQNLYFKVNFSKVVTVIGTPYISVVIGAKMVHATYFSSSGSSALVFRYTVQSGDRDTDGITVGAITLNGGSLKDWAGNDAVTVLNSVGSTAGVKVEAVAPQLIGIQLSAVTQIITV